MNGVSAATALLRLHMTHYSAEWLRHVHSIIEREAECSGNRLAR